MDLLPDLRPLDTSLRVEDLAAVTEAQAVSGELQAIAPYCIRGYDTYSRFRLPDLLPLIEPPIVAQSQEELRHIRTRMTRPSHAIS